MINENFYVITRPDDEELDFITNGHLLFELGRHAHKEGPSNTLLELLHPDTELVDLERTPLTLEQRDPVRVRLYASTAAAEKPCWAWVDEGYLRILGHPTILRALPADGLVLTALKVPARGLLIMPCRCDPPGPWKTAALAVAAVGGSE